MTPYRPVAYRQLRLSGSRRMGQTFDEILGIPPAAGDALRLVGHGIGAWFGIYIGTNPRCALGVRIIGWVMGTGMGVAAILDGVSLVKRATGTHP